VPRCPTFGKDLADRGISNAEKKKHCIVSAEQPVCEWQWKSPATSKARNRRWQIGKVNPLNEEHDGAAAVYAVAGPLEELEPQAQ
jgi:hypothetical protein